MTDRERTDGTGSPDGYAWTFDEHLRRQARRGLEMTPAERLRWLEETLAELREIQGRAALRRSPCPPGPGTLDPSGDRDV